jgi:hypothetical protein
MQVGVIGALLLKKLHGTFDKEIFIRRIKDPRSVYLDPNINEVDGLMLGLDLSLMICRRIYMRLLILS